MNRRDFLKSGVMAGGMLLLPGLLKAQQKDLLKEFDEKWGYLKFYSNVPALYSGRIIEVYVEFPYRYRRNTPDGVIRPFFMETNSECDHDVTTARNSVPPDVWNSFAEKKKKRDFATGNRRDFAKANEKLTVPGPRDYPCQMDNEFAGIAINARFDQSGNKFKDTLGKEYESYPQVVKVNRQSEILPLTQRELLIREYRMKCDIVRRVLPIVRAYANKNNLSYCAFAKGLTPYDPHRYDPDVRMLGYILMQDKRDGVFRVVNQDIPKIAIKLDGSPIRNSLGNQEDIPGYKDALFFDQDFVKKIVALQKQKEEEQARAMVIVPYTEFVIVSANPRNFAIEAVTPKKYKDPTTGQLVTSFETSTL
jgi:hypothetical protein